MRIKRPRQFPRGAFYYALRPQPYLLVIEATSVVDDDDKSSK